MLDVQLVDTLGHDGISYTADAAEAERRVREGEAAVAYLLRPDPDRGRLRPRAARRGAAAEDDLLLPEADLRPFLSTPCDAVARRRPHAVGEIKAVLAELPTRAEREPVLQTGEGGDETTAIDAAAETAVVHRLEQLDEEFTLVSRSSASGLGSGRPWRVVCDPIDGSLNAKRDIPSSRSRSRSRRERRWPTSSLATSTTSAPARSGRPSGAAAFSTADVSAR